jgi:hypothetical protein
LLQAFLYRLERRQALAVPRDVRRYFISHREAGELCTLAAFTVPNRHVAFPKLDACTELQSLQDIAVRVLRFFGFAAVFFEEEERARVSVESLAGSGSWPVLLTSLDTSGEKSYEEFVGDGEIQLDIGLDRLLALRHSPSRAMADGLFDRLEEFVNYPVAAVGKADIVALIQQSLANFSHIDRGRNLDQRF